jgi:hypothetical protein
VSGYCSLKYGLPSVHRTVDGLQIMVCSSSPTRYLIMSAVKVAYVCKFRHPFFSNSLFSLDIAKFSQLLSQVVLDNLVDWTALITSNNIPVPVLLQQIQSLTQLASPLTLKTIFNSSAKDYKLAWVTPTHFYPNQLHFHSLYDHRNRVDPITFGFYAHKVVI